jgi:hypothetical protein
MMIEERSQKSAFRTGRNDFEPMEVWNAQTCMSSYYNHSCFALTEEEFMTAGNQGKRKRTFARRSIRKSSRPRNLPEKGRNVQAHS